MRQNFGRPKSPLGIDLIIFTYNIFKGRQNLGAFNLKYEMRRTYQFSKRLRALLKFWRILKQMDIERTECIPKDDFGFPKFWRILKQMYIERTECVPKGNFGPAEAVGRSQTRPVESLGAYSVHLHTLYLNISTKIFAIAYSYGECIIKSGRHIF